ncbi:hypothetical protein ACFV0Y_31480 [Streptomyces sp. NPDC059569]|uniref:hypothetical protein n=1 Tax=Streptomyces sp. NPDC059569 TaxID=3346869 RepID=UPI00367F119F
MGSVTRWQRITGWLCGVAHGPLPGDEDLRVEHLDGQLAGEGFGLLPVLQYSYDAAHVVLFDAVGCSDGLGAPVREPG